MNAAHISSRPHVRLAAGALACACALALAGCSNASRQASDAITQGLSADLQSLQQTGTSMSDELASSAFAAQLADAGIDASGVYGPMFSHLTYHVDGVDVSSDGTTAVAHVTVTNKDLARAFANYQSSLTDALSASDAREQLGSLRNDDAAFMSYLMTMLSSAVSDDGLPSVTAQVDVPYTLTDGVWSADDTSDLRRAVLGGLDASQLQDAAASAAAEAASQVSDAVTLPATEADAQPVVTDGAEPAADGASAETPEADAVGAE